MIKAVIIEDEDIAATRLQNLLADINSQISVIDKIPSITEAVIFFKTSKVDLIFLDINLLDGNSFEIFNQVQINTPIIFTTAYSEYAIKAFEQNSIDYLLKPITKASLIKSLDKFESIKKESIPDFRKIFLESQNLYKKRFLVKMNNRLQSISIDDVAYFYSEDKLTFLVKKDSTRVPLNDSLKKLENELNPVDFFRINRQIIVCNKAIVDMYYTSKSRIRLMLEPSINEVAIVALEKMGSFKKWLSQ